MTSTENIANIGEQTPNPINPPEHVEKVSVKVPTFWEKAPELYFANIEAQFKISGITHDTTKYYAVIASLNSDVLSHISDIVLNPPATGKYEAIKVRLISEFADSQEKRLKALLSEMVLGDDRPSHLLRKMTQLAGTNISAEIVKSLWLKRLPQQTQAILAIANVDINNLAQMADKLVEINSPPSTECYAIATSSNNSDIAEMKQQISELTKQVSQLAMAQQKPQRAERYRSRERNFNPHRHNRSTSRKKNLNTTDYCEDAETDEQCYFHAKFGSKARRCRFPCIFAKNE